MNWWLTEWLTNFSVLLSGCLINTGYTAEGGIMVPTTLVVQHKVKLSYSPTFSRLLWFLPNFPPKCTFWNIMLIVASGHMCLKSMNIYTYNNIKIINNMFLCHICIPSHLWSCFHARPRRVCTSVCLKPNNLCVCTHTHTRIWNPRFLGIQTNFSFLTRKKCTRVCQKLDLT